MFVAWVFIWCVTAFDCGWFLMHPAFEANPLAVFFGMWIAVTYRLVTTTAAFVLALLAPCRSAIALTVIVFFIHVALLGVYAWSYS